jgi:branched-chain amino acid transport system ATP-binding protein
MGEVLLRTKNLYVSYGKIEALKGIDFYVETGEIVCIIGANGAGKTTFLKSVMGLLTLQGGEIYYENKLILSKEEALPTNKIVESGISLVPEGRRIFTDLTVLENLEMGAFLIKDKKKYEKRLNEVFSLFPILKERQKQKAGLLSGGEQQMLAISRALMSYPKLLLLDEPSLGLAPLVVKNILEVLKKINVEENVTICLVEQNAKMALKISNRGYVMETGKIVLEGSSGDLLDNPAVKSAYLGE